MTIIEKYVSEKVKVIFFPIEKVKLKNYWRITYAMRSSKIIKKQPPEVFCITKMYLKFSQCAHRKTIV